LLDVRDASAGLTARGDVKGRGMDASIDIAL
jgi:hypothetical protein